MKSKNAGKAGAISFFVVVGVVILAGLFGVGEEKREYSQWHQELKYPYDEVFRGLPEWHRGVHPEDVGSVTNIVEEFRSIHEKGGYEDLTSIKPLDLRIESVEAVRENYTQNFRWRSYMYTPGPGEGAIDWRFKGTDVYLNGVKTGYRFHSASIRREAGGFKEVVVWYNKEDLLELVLVLEPVSSGKRIVYLSEKSTDWYQTIRGVLWAGEVPSSVTIIK